MNERNEYIRTKGKAYYNKLAKITGAINKIKYFIDGIEYRELEEIQEYLNNFASTEIKFNTTIEADIFLMAFTEERIKKSKLKANKKWTDENREHANYLKARSAARSFLRNKATKEDLEEFKELIEGLTKEN